MAYLPGLFPQSRYERLGSFAEIDHKISDLMGSCHPVINFAPRPTYFQLPPPFQAPTEEEI